MSRGSPFADENGGTRQRIRTDKRMTARAIRLSARRRRPLLRSLTETSGAFSKELAMSHGSPLTDENDAAIDNANPDCSRKHRAAIFKGVVYEPRLTADA